MDLISHLSTMDFEKIDSNQSITSAYSDCVTLFRDFYFSLASDQCTLTDEVSLPKVSDKYGKLNIWGANRGTLRMGCGSLDDILRNDKKLKALVFDILTDLIDSLEKGVTNWPSFTSAVKSGN